MPDYQRMHKTLEVENRKLRETIYLASQDLSLLIAKHAIGKDRTAIRMTKCLHAKLRETA